MRTCTRVAVRTAICLAILTYGSVSAPRTTAQGIEGWQHASIDTSVAQLFVQPGGLLLARADDSIVRSADGGATWSSIALPADLNHLDVGQFRSAQVAVDAIDPNVMAVASADGVYLQQSAQAGWTRILSVGSSDVVQGIAISPTNDQYIFVILGGLRPGSDLRILVSQDQGANWGNVYRQDPSPQGTVKCDAYVTLFQLHPTDLTRLFGFWGCGQAPNLLGFTGLNESRDSGHTWTTTAAEGTTVWPNALAGGEASSPERFYLAASVPQSNSPGSRLERSDDDMRTWHDIGDSLWDASTIVGYRPTITSLVAEPTNLDNIYIGLAGYGRGVWKSSDGGQSWQDLEFDGDGAITTLGLNSDNSVLYAGTTRGIWSLSLSSAETD